MNRELSSVRCFWDRDRSEEDAQGDQKVHLWHYRLDLDAEREAALARVLDDAESDRVSRYRFGKHRRRFVAGRGALRMILAQYAGCEPEALRFEHGVHGKPYIGWPNSACDIRFSASNSHGLGAVAVTWRNELGLDLEQVRPNCDHDLIASREFSPEESDWLCRLPEAKRLVAFYQLWTCKEAYLKGKGVGLTVPLNDFAISLSQETPRLVWSNINDSDPERWSLQPLSIEPGFVACLAMEGGCRAVQSERWFP